MYRSWWQQLIGMPSRRTVKLKMPRHLPSEDNLEKDLIVREGRIGATIFGDIPEGRERLFACIDEYTWLWNERWIQDDGSAMEQSVQYEIRGGRVLKSFQGQYRYVEGEELRNFMYAVKQYHDLVSREVYQVEPLQLAQTIPA